MESNVPSDFAPTADIISNLAAMDIQVCESLQDTFGMPKHA